MKDFASPQLRFETDFFRQKNNLSIRRDRKIRSLQAKTIHILLALAVLGLAGLASYRTARFVLTCDQLRVRQFSISQAPKFSAGRVAAVLQEVRGNILVVSIPALRERLLKIPEIAGVSITRLLPGTIALHFELRTPLYALEEPKGFRLFTAGGLEISTSATMPPGLVRVRGVAETDIPHIAAASQEIVRLGKAIDYVTYQRPYGITLRRAGHAPLFSPGEDRFLEKLAEYDRIQPRLPWPEESIQRVDLRIAGRVYLQAGEEETTADEE